MLDIAIVGGGPAGLSAGIQAAIRGKEITVFSNAPEKSYLYKAEKIDNYLGMPGVSGKDMMDTFLSHAKGMGVKIARGKVVNIVSMGGSFLLNVENEFFEARSVILAIGAARKKSIPGESELIGRGVSYCATCDGPLYRGKTVAVVADEPGAAGEANYLAGLAEKVYFMTRKKDYGALSEGIEVIGREPTAIEGGEKVERVIVGGEGIAVGAVFVLREALAAENLISGLETEKAFIKVGAGLETNIPGVFAAGDCIGRPLQLAKAVGEGLVAADNAVRFVDSYAV